MQENRSDVWIGTGTPPYRVAATLGLGGASLAELLPGVTGASLDVRADVGGFDEEAEIVAPPQPPAASRGRAGGSGAKTMPGDGTVADLRAMFANPHVVAALLVDGAEFAGVVERDAVDDDTPDERPARDAPLAQALAVLDAGAERRLVVLDRDGRTLRGLLCLTSDRSGFCQS